MSHLQQVSCQQTEEVPCDIRNRDQGQYKYSRCSTHTQPRRGGHSVYPSRSDGGWTNMQNWSLIHQTPMSSFCWLICIKGCQLLRVFSQGGGIWGEISQFNLFVKSVEKSAPLRWSASMLSQEVICQGDLLAGARTGASRYSWNVIARYWMLLVLWNKNLIHLQKYVLSWINDSSVWSISLKYLRRSKIFGGSCFRIMLLRETVFHLPLVHYSLIWRRSTESHPSLLSPAAYCCELLAEEGIYKPIRCVNPQLLKQ